MGSVLIIEVRAPGGDERTMKFDPGFDRRVIIGRAQGCDVVVQDASISRKHTMLIATPGGWRVQDLGSSNGTHLNGQLVHDAALRDGDVIAYAKSALTVRLEAGPTAQLVVDLAAGTATLAGYPLPLSAAELIWFAFLASHRESGEGWVTAGRDGHPALAAWTKDLLERDWARDVKSKPLLDLAHGHDVDDEDLKNLRAKTAQKLKSFASGERAWMAALVVPEVQGKNRQRLPLPPEACVLR